MLLPEISNSSKMQAEKQYVQGKIQTHTYMLDVNAKYSDIDTPMSKVKATVLVFLS